MGDKNQHASETSEDRSVTAAGAPDAPEADASPAAGLQAELEAARALVGENQERFLRAKAETENARRRAEIDVANARKYAIERFAAEMLAVKDSLELARTVDLTQERDTAVQKMHEGLDLTLKLTDDIFKRFALTTLDPRGEKFDPQQHHAVTTVETNEVPPNHVVNVLQKGYLLHDRVLRPAMVTVARAPTADTSAATP